MESLHRRVLPKKLKDLVKGGPLVVGRPQIEFSRHCQKFNVILATAVFLIYHFKEKVIRLYMYHLFEYISIPWSKTIRSYTLETQKELLNSDTSITLFSPFNVFSKNHSFSAFWRISVVLMLAGAQTPRFPDKLSFQIILSLRSESGKWVSYCPHVSSLTCFTFILSEDVWIFEGYHSLVGIFCSARCPAIRSESLLTETAWC